MLVQLLRSSRRAVVKPCRIERGQKIANEFVFGNAQLPRFDLSCSRALA